MQFLSEVIFLFHDVREALMGDVEKVDKGLDVACFQKTGAYAFLVIIFMLFSRCHVIDCLPESFFVADFMRIVLAPNLV